MKIYLAGPMSGIPEHNYPAFERCAMHLRTLGHEVKTPPELNAEMAFTPSADGSIEKHDYAACFHRDVDAVLWCEAIALMQGWMLSKGAKLEAHLAAVLNKQFMFEHRDGYFELDDHPQFHILVTSGGR